MLSSFPLNIVMVALANEIRQEKEMKYWEWKKKILPFAEAMIVYTGKPEITHRQNTKTNEYSKISGLKINV